MGTPGNWKITGCGISYRSCSTTWLITRKFLTQLTATRSNCCSPEMSHSGRKLWLVKILLVHNRYQQPGGEDVVFEQERKLLESAGHQVVTHCRSNDEVNDSSIWQRVRLAKNTVSSAESRQQVLNLLRQHHFDVVHVHNTFMMISPSIYSACR